MTGDTTLSPWPAPGRFIELRLRRAVWCSVRPWYGSFELYDIYRVFMLRCLFPFFTVNTKWFHLYIGWKPITLDDPKFYWRLLDVAEKGKKDGVLFVQLSARWGLGAIS